MGLIKGGLLRLSQTFLYVLAFICSALIVGIYSYFLSVLADRNISIPTYAKAVEGISAIAVLFTLSAILLTCCLGGMKIFGALAILLNLLVMGGFIAIAVLTRSATHSCTGSNIRTGPLGNAANSSFDNEVTYSVSPRTACRLNKTVFIVAIIGAVIFAICAIVQVLLVRSQQQKKKEEQRDSFPVEDSYNNGYGYSEKKRPFWQKKNKTYASSSTTTPVTTTTPTTTGGPTTTRAMDLQTSVPAGTATTTRAGSGATAMRPSYETSTTLGGAGVYDKDAGGVVPVSGGVVYGHETATNVHTQHHHY